MFSIHRNFQITVGIKTVHKKRSTIVICDNYKNNLFYCKKLLSLRLSSVISKWLQKSTRKLNLCVARFNKWDWSIDFDHHHHHHHLCSITDKQPKLPLMQLTSAPTLILRSKTSLSVFLPLRFEAQTLVRSPKAERSWCFHHLPGKGGKGSTDTRRLQMFKKPVYIRLMKWKRI